MNFYNGCVLDLGISPGELGPKERFRNLDQHVQCSEA